MTGRLLLTLHDVTPHHGEAIRAIMDDMAGLVGPGACGLLLVPDFHGEARLDRDPSFVKAVRRWAGEGSEVFLHGYFHQDRSDHQGAGTAFKARHLTAGEGEFLGLERARAAALLCDGRKLVEDVAGKAVAGFIAPAWLYGPDALEAISEAGFTCVEDHFRVWNPQSGATYARGPVISYATRTPARALSSLAFSKFASLGLRGQRTVRIAVHPADRGSARVYREVRHRVARFARTHSPSGYAALSASACPR
ncbi:MAG: polysaccharide deacetylase family protein [Novosphingobium sp.]|nr:polysaccharide deacetylase family protein [Novosphingobium sp.]